MPIGGVALGRVCAIVVMFTVVMYTIILFTVVMSTEVLSTEVYVVMFTVVMFTVLMFNNVHCSLLLISHQNLEFPLNSVLIYVALTNPGSMHCEVSLHTNGGQ